MLKVNDSESSDVNDLDIKNEDNTNLNSDFEESLNNKFEDNPGFKVTFYLEKIELILGVMF